MNLVDYLQNMNINELAPALWGVNANVMQPGDSYEAPVYTAK
jgi:hypothetical protein